MSVHSKPGHGSRFEAWLPIAADATAVAGLALLPLGRGQTILVVESEREWLLRNEEMLAALGYEPVGFERPANAIAAWRAAPERFDAVVVSHASAADGLRVVRALHEIASRQPKLLAPAAATDISVDELAEAGISEVLHRPLVSTEIAAALARCLRSSDMLQT
jgi:DNA-binding NtrC family response regulator